MSRYNRKDALVAVAIFLSVAASATLVLATCFDSGLMSYPVLAWIFLVATVLESWSVLILRVRQGQDSYPEEFPVMLLYALLAIGGVALAIHIRSELFLWVAAILPALAPGTLAIPKGWKKTHQSDG